MTLEESVNKFILEKKSYYKQWIFEEPLVISNEHNLKLVRLQKIMYRLITEFVTNNKCYRNYMPLSNKVEFIIDECNKKEYQVGTYRTDFVYDKSKGVKIIEITCRFALNGIFLSALMNDVAEDYRVKKWPNLKTKNYYNGIYKRLQSYVGDSKSIYVLKGGDQRNESKIYKDIFKRTGIDIFEINYKEIQEFIPKMKKSLIISELSFDEILSIPKSVLSNLVKLNLINDFRTVFLVHDKRLFSVLGKKELQEKVLNKSDIEFFKRFYVPTYNYDKNSDLWMLAKKEKENWIIKHRAFGKSQKVYAGLVTDQKKWEELFLSDEVEDMIIQKWVPQERINGKIGEISYKDYVTGTLLFFDDNYYGFGDFRTSSYPITNKVDHRKATSLILSEDQDNLVCTAKNFIN